MTEHHKGTREWAEAEARKGAKVRNVTWAEGSWVAYDGDSMIAQIDGLIMANYTFDWSFQPQTGWSIYEPAPAQAPDLAARVAELERRLEAHTHRYFDGQSIVATDAPSYESVPEPAPDFTTSRKPAAPAPGVMTDQQIIDAAIKLSVDGVPEATTVIRLTRANIRAQLAANEQAGRDAAYTIWNAENGEHGSVKFAKAISAALKAHKEGV